LTIFEDFNEDYNILYCFSHIDVESPIRSELIKTPSPSVRAALARRSVNLERLFASYIIDARDFFEPNWIWDNLTSLASRLLTLK